MSIRLLKMKLKFIFCPLLLIILINHLYPQQVFKYSIKNYQITLAKNVESKFVLEVKQKNKLLLKKISSVLRLYFYNLDSQPEDEMILVLGLIKGNDTLNTLYVYTFEDKFKFCDSIYLDKYLPEFYQFDFDENFFIKVYDFEIEKLFPSSRKELPFTFFYLNNCLLEFDNIASFEEYETEINYLVDEIYDIKRNLNCENEKLKNDYQRLLACLYLNLINSSKSFDFENFVKKNYLCDDREMFLKKINSLFESE